MALVDKLVVFNDELDGWFNVGYFGGMGYDGKFEGTRKEIAEVSGVACIGIEGVVGNGIGDVQTELVSGGDDCNDGVSGGVFAAALLGAALGRVRACGDVIGESDAGYIR